MITVLVVDDHPAMRRLIRRLLSSHGNIHVVAEAASGEEALECVREYEPDVMTLDMMMDGMTGLEVLQRLKNYQKRPKVIVLSLYHTWDLKEKAMENSASAYIPKKELISGKLLETIELLASESA
jgi:CheY-like chemotaxis protein